MSKVTKWAVDEAKRSMNFAIDKKVSVFTAGYVLKVKMPTRSRLAELCTQDTNWKAHVVKQARDDENYVRISTSDMIEHSPLARAAYYTAKKEFDKRDEKAEQLKTQLTERRDEIIRKAIIGQMECADLLKEVTAFCK